MTSPGTDRMAITNMLTTLFNQWGLSTQERLDAIGTRDTLERAGLLLGIHKRLRRMFPYNRNLAYAWMRAPNETFDNRSPIEVICESGGTGLLIVQAYLDRAIGQ